MNGESDLNRLGEREGKMNRVILTDRDGEEWLEQIKREGGKDE